MWIKVNDREIINMNAISNILIDVTGLIYIRSGTKWTTYASNPPQFGKVDVIADREFIEYIKIQFQFADEERNYYIKNGS